MQSVQIDMHAGDASPIEYTASLDTASGLKIPDDRVGRYLYPRGANAIWYNYIFLSVSI